MSDAHPAKRSFAARYAPQDSISPDELESGLKWLQRNAVLGKIMNTLTVGAFLTAFALEIGASNAAIGVLAAVPQLGNVGQLLGVYLIERLRVRRAVCIGFGMMVRPMLLVIAAAVLIPSPMVALAVLVVALAVRYLLGSVMLCSWNSWLRDLVPDDQRAGFLARNLRATTFFGMLISLAAAGFIDGWRTWQVADPKFAYSLIFLTAFVIGCYNVYTLTKIPEPRMAAAKEKFDLLKVLKRPIRDLHYRQSLMFFGSWNFAINLATPFFTVHMLQRLDLDLMTVILFAVISQTANILALPQWGRLIERYSSKAVLSVCAPAFLLCILAWTLTTFPDRYILTLPVLFMIHVVTGTATAGVAVASGNLAMKMAPRGGATAYLSANSLVNSLAAGVAPVIGGLLADFFLTRGFSVLFYWESPQAGIMIEAVRIQEWDFFFIFAAVLGLYSLHRLSTVHEEGAVKEGPVLAEFMQAARDGLRTLSTVAGLYAVTDFRFGFRRRKTKRRGSRPPHPPEPVVAPPPQG